MSWIDKMRRAYQHGDWFDVIRYGERAIATREPTQHNVYYVLQYACSRLGMADEAINYCHRAIKVERNQEIVDNLRSNIECYRNVMAKNGQVLDQYIRNNGGALAMFHGGWLPAYLGNRF